MKTKSSFLLLFVLIGFSIAQDPGTFQGITTAASVSADQSVKRVNSPDVCGPSKVVETALVQADENDIQYHGNVRSHIFHGPSCRYYSCKNCTRVFKTREAAIAAGYRPCKICKP